MIVSSYSGPKTKQEGPWCFLLAEITNSENREALSYKAYCALTDCSVVITYLMPCGFNSAYKWGPMLLFVYRDDIM